MMKKKLIESLNWQVYVVNSKQIMTANVFTLSGNFVYFFDKAIKEYGKTKDTEQFVKDVERALKYVYWGKSEYEVLVAGLFGEEERKVDIYEQVALNWDRFVDYMLRTLKIQKGEED